MATGDALPARQLPPGVERRLALMEHGEAVVLSDFTDDERELLMRDLSEFRAAVRAGRRP